MEEDSIEMGPNGSLIFCLEYLLDHIEWLDDKLVDIDDDYLIIDCPGQIELYTHLDIMVRFLRYLQARNYYVCAVYIQDAQMVNDCHKFVGGILSHSCLMYNFSCSTVQGLSCRILRFILCHTFSMGDRSGLQAGQSSGCTLLPRSHAVVTRAECGLALSC